ncbi:Cytochrome c oxidase subunit 1 [Pleodorina starrii]|nr:Cytochrome c oxidase subunit 1 [Pleodorina starrii]
MVSAPRLQGWGLHVWGDTPSCTQWQQPLKPTSVTAGGLVWDLPLRSGAQRVGALVHKGEQKAASGEVQIHATNGAGDIGVSGGGGGGAAAAEDGRVVQEIWLVGSEHRAFPSPPDLSQIPAGSVNKQAGHWVSPNLLLWRQAPGDVAGPRTFRLGFHSKGYMWINGAGVQGPEASWELAVAPPQAAFDAIKRFPHLYGTTPLVVPPEAAARVSELVTGQLLVSVYDANGEALDGTGVQIQGVLDETLTYDGPLGDHPDPATGGHAITLWAPTATDVKLLHYRAARGGNAEVFQMTRGSGGTWTLPRPDDWLWSYYTYRVTNFCPWTARFETVEVTDPYSRGLAADGVRTQIVDLSDPATQPPGWLDHAPPHLEQWTDISVYELHVRDFSMMDDTVPERLRGKYLAFCPERIASGSSPSASFAAAAAGVPPTSDTNPGQHLSAGLAHLAALRSAGLNHLHLLPTYDFATVPEREEEQLRVKDDLSAYPPDSPTQQAAVLAVADSDGFNWGYDPVHWGVPEGSYATDPDGIARIREFREMVQSLHSQGWRVVQDVVYNHTFASGPASRYSVLDKIVPGYYHRRHEDGTIADSTCCNNTASEHIMCERLVVEDITHWARNYKVDGFRFDIMGHLMLSTMNKIRASLDALTPEKDHGVIGRSIYLYGEAWDFGEVAGNQRGRNAAQMNLAGTRLGAFNDRLRDGALGGGPFAPPQFQGLVTGLLLAPNPAAERDQGGPGDQRAELLVLTDWVRAALAGNLRVYPLHLCDGTTRTGEEVLAHGQPLAYGGLPCEHVAFIGCHDNKTMFDQIIEKSSVNESSEERMRMAVLCLALISLSQGVPFIHAGDDLLRSKSLDRDSYNSGDWFNRIDWTAATHNFGVGLPVSSKNGGSWPYMRDLLAQAERIRPSREQILAATRIFQALLRVRYSSPLFRLAAPADVVRQVAFHNTGPDQIPGVIVMELVSAPYDNDGDGSSIKGVYDPSYERLIVVFNCAPYDNDLPYPRGVPQGGRLELHPDLAAVGDARLSAAAADDAARLLRLPPRTAAVFVQRRQ